MFTKEATIDALRAKGMRITPQRVAVVEELVGNVSHPTAEHVARKVTAHMPNVSLSTIYNTLNELADAGLVQRVTTDGTVRFDPDTTVHGHLRCERCGDVVDLALPSGFDGLLRETYRGNRVEIRAVSLDFEGVCTHCLGHTDR